MEVNIGEVNSTLRTTDHTSHLAPETLERIVKIVMDRMREEEGHRQRSEAERRLWPGVAHDER